MKRRQKGMGSITYLGKGRRKPYLASVRKQTIGTYQTIEKAEKALLCYVINDLGMFPDYIHDDHTKVQYIDMIYKLQNDRILPKSIYDFPEMDFFDDMIKNKLYLKEIANTPAFNEIWESIFMNAKKSRSLQWERSMSAAYKKFEAIHTIPIAKITAQDIQNCFNISMEKGIGSSSLNNMMIVLSMIYRDAEKHKYITKNDNPCEYIEYSPTGLKRDKRHIFSYDEIDVLKNDNAEESKLILLYILTGMRPIELLSILRKDIHLDDRYMIGGLKTDAGKERIIPLHNYAIDLVKYFLDKYDTDFLLNTTGLKAYQNYLYKYKETMNRLRLDHSEPYDTRYTFATIAKTSNVDSSVRKKIMGHKCKDLTDDVYTHEPLAYFLKEINKINI